MALKSSNKVDTNTYEIEVTVDAQTFADACKSAYMKQRKSIQIPGFRKGKATQGMVEKVYGEGAFYEEALEILYPNAVQSAIDEAELKVVGQPFDLDVPVMSKAEGVEMKMKVTTYPEVKLGEYKGLEAKMLDTEATDDDVAEELKNMQDRNSRLVTVEDRAAEMGDTAEIDFEGFVDGVAFEGGKGENYPLELGSGSFIPGFEEQVVGHKSEEEFDVNVTFPEEYAEELAGKDAVFKCKIHEIKSKELPELDDDFAKDVSEFDTLDELKADLKKQIGERKTASANTDFENQLLEQVCDNMEVEIPECMFDQKCDEMIQDYAYRL
ncbi:MAG: trigger factor, partial [Eubacterium sp.]